jgi:hypothetical protein
MVLYTLSEADAAKINARRDADRNSGNRVEAGQDCAAIVVAAWGNSSANLQVLLDGTDTYWATSRSEGDEQGHWHWPPRA